MKFEKQKLTVGETKVYHLLDNSSFEIVASRRGIEFRGESPHLESVGDLDIFAKAVGDAWKDHLALLPKLATTLSGH